MEYKYCHKYERLFSNKSRLSSLPDISNWNTNNVKDISNLFSNCSRLSSLPDISKWNINKNININNFFLIVHIYYQYLIYQNGIQIM